MAEAGSTASISFAAFSEDMAEGEENKKEKEKENESINFLTVEI